MRHVSSGLVMCAVIAFFACTYGETRSKEIGVIDYLRKYTETPAKSACARYKEDCHNAIAQIGLAPEWIDVDIFLSANKKNRDEYKRIFIPAGTEWFTQAMYEGMDDYVKSGGLLITNCSLLLLDANANYKVDKEDTMTDFPRDNFLGVFGHGSCLMTRIRVVQDCPLTKGIEPDAWVALDKEVGGRQTRNSSAEVLVLSDRIVKGTPKGEQPFLTYKHMRHGACIYLVGQIGPVTDKSIRQIFANVCSAEALDWLCLQE